MASQLPAAGPNNPEGINAIWGVSLRMFVCVRRCPGGSEASPIFLVAECLTGDNLGGRQAKAGRENGGRQCNFMFDHRHGLAVDFAEDRRGVCTFVSVAA